MRIENGIVKKYISDIAPTTLTTGFTRTALKMQLGLTDIRGDLVIPAPDDRIEDIPMLGLAVRSDKQGPIGAHRVLILVQGTSESQLLALGDTQNSQDASYQVSSSRVKLNAC